MPELPEVETVRRTLKELIINKKITYVDIYYDKLIEYPYSDEFKERIKGQLIKDIKRKGKWLMFELDDYYMLSHLRMEGKFFLKNDEPILKHEHIIFHLDDGKTLRYQDTRKFGKIHLIEKDKVYNCKPLNELGLEPWDKDLTCDYLRSKFKNKKIPIKTVLLDQSIITGIGNIYADEILFLSHLNPLKRSNELNDNELINIIKYTRQVLSKAIEMGGTTIRSYESSEGVHGRFQNNLLVHNHEGDNCIKCGELIIKIKVNGRGTYYCPNCQKQTNVLVCKKTKN